MEGRMTSADVAGYLLRLAHLVEMLS